MKTTLSCIILTLVMAAIPAAAGDHSESKSPASEATLYERLGGVYAIATVVDDFIERLLVNDQLNANPAIDAARHRVPKAGLKYRVTSLMCQVTGGPQKYTGRSMKDSHEHLNITSEEWDVMVEEFLQVLDRHEVPEREQQELLALIAPTRDDIVTIE